jgi:hypothetical protein
MLKIKGFVKPSYIIHRSKNQLGNTLIPVIIALAISAVASIAFLKQGADLSAQAKVLEAQYEVAAILQEWNRLKSAVGISAITGNTTVRAGDFPSNLTNIYGGDVRYSKNFFFTTGRLALTYNDIAGDISNCNQIYNTFRDAEGVSQVPIIYRGSPFPSCFRSPSGVVGLVLPLE